MILVGGEVRRGHWPYAHARARGNRAGRREGRSTRAVKLIHVADIHLGRRRWDGRLPDGDFAKAFRYVADVAVAERADAVLIAGDLFDRPQVEPPHLRQAQVVLALLRDAGIPVVATEGNHDKGFLHANEATWLDYLADDGLLMLLVTRFGPEGPRLVPWDPSTRRGSYLDLGGVRFVGAGYLGAATPRKVRELVEALDAERSHVMLLHAGPDYFVGEGGGFGKADLETIRARVRYLALGHIHKPMVYEGWACNPGSPENCEVSEARYDRDRAGRPVPRGFACVEIDADRRDGGARIEVRSVPRRPVLEVELDASPFGNKLKQGAEAVASAVARKIRDAAPSAETAVMVRLTGRLNLRRVALDAVELGDAVARDAGVLAVGVDLTGINEGGGADGTTGADDAENVSRADLERAAVRALVSESEFSGLAEGTDALADLLLELKDGVQRGRSGEELAERIRTDALVDRLLAMEPPGPDVGTVEAGAGVGDSGEGAP